MEPLDPSVGIAIGISVLGTGVMWFKFNKWWELGGDFIEFAWLFVGLGALTTIGALAEMIRG